MITKGLINKRLVLLGLLSVGVSSCASSDQITLLERRINSLAIENTQIREELKAMKGQQLRADIENIQKNQARLDNRLNEINAELLRVSGTIDQLSHNYNRDRARLDKLELGIAGGMTQPQTQSPQDSVLDEPDTLPKTTPTSPTAVASIPQKPPVTAPATDPYKQGIEAFKQKNFKDAKKFFEQYIKENPQGKFVSNSHFWIGECEYNMNRFEEAILAYQVVIEKYPNSEKTPGALLKQGISFQKIGDNSSAKAVFNKLLKHYPNSPQAAIANDYLKKL